MIKQPSKWKTAILVWIAIYPTITILFVALGDVFARITPLPLQTFVTTLIIVPLMAFFIMPFLQRLFTGWLNK
jgi:antibiotic biosynthesis monooxygenase (ABM) superfamily enzyme